MKETIDPSLRRFVNICLGISCACGVVVGAFDPGWAVILGLIASTASALALLELNGNNVTTY